MNDTPRTDAALLYSICLDLQDENNALKERIKRLEEALDTLTLVVGLTPIVGNKYALQKAMDMARAELKAKEAKLSVNPIQSLGENLMKAGIGFTTEDKL